MASDADNKGLSTTAKGTVFFTPERCKGCGMCVTFCPTKALGMSKRLNHKGYSLPELANPDLCIGCDLCGLYCPDFAVFGINFKKVQGKEGGV